LTPTCTTCHKAHGNQNPYGLIYLKGTGAVTEEGDADGQTEGLRTMCKQCHSQGG
jgi:nitrate reductase cytochrome c-type subunit